MTEDPSPPRHPAGQPLATGVLALPVIRPLPARTLVAGLSVTVFLAALFSYFVEVPRREYVAGWLEPMGGEVRIQAPYAAVVVAIAEPGTDVAAAAPVVTLKESRTGVEGDVAASQAASAQANLRAVSNEAETLGREQLERELGLQRQLGLAKSMVEQAAAEATSRREAVQLQEAELERTRSLVAQGFLAPGRLEQLQSQQRLQQAEVQAAVRAHLSAQAQLEALQGELAQSRTRSAVALSEKRRLASDLTAQRSALSSAVESQLVAPHDALVLASAVTRGSSVSPGQLLAVLAPKNAPMHALLQVPARAAARVVPGQSVQLRMAAYPFEVFGPVHAVIERVEQASLRPDESSLLRQASGAEPVVRATARIVDVPPDVQSGTPAVALRSGMQFEASVEIERRTLLAWVMWPLLRHFN
jgi:membrane fusion protein